MLEYYLDTLWKGTLLFVACLFLVSLGLVSQVWVSGPAPHGPPPLGTRPAVKVPPPAAPPLRRCPRRPQVHKQETWAFPAYGMGVGLWLVISSLPRRRLVLNHTRGMYHFSIQGRTVCRGPLHLVYVRLALSSDGDDRGGLPTPGVVLGRPLGSGERPALPSPAPGVPRPWSRPTLAPPRDPRLSRTPVASVRKVLLSAGSVWPQTGASGAGTPVRALRGGSGPGDPDALPTPPWFKGSWGAAISQAVGDARGPGLGLSRRA